MNTFTIPTHPSDNTREPGHFGAEVVLIIKGANRDGGPGGWGVSGWTAEGEGRTEFQGPMVQGPRLGVFGLCSVMAAGGHGTGAANARKEAEGLLVRCEAGDRFIAEGTTFELQLVNGWPSFRVVA